MVGLVYLLRLVSISYVCCICMPSSKVTLAMLQIEKLGLVPTSYVLVPVGLYVDYSMVCLLVC